MLDPNIVEGLATGLVDLYSDAEAVLLNKVTTAVAKGNSTAYATTQLEEVRNLRREAATVVAGLNGKVVGETANIIGVAAQRGTISAADDLAFRGLSTSAAGVIDRAATQALVTETLTKVRGTHIRLLRSTDDAYRQVIAEVTGRVLTGAVTREQAAQQALDRLAKHGITGFTDRAGRNWNIATYVEMATRSSVMRAFQAGHMAKLQANGIDLVRVSSHANPAPQCAPFENKILSLSGENVGTVEMESELDGSPVKVKVLASMKDATSRGLHHPNAILGGTQRIDTLGGVFNGVRAWYEGPCINVTSSRGNHFSVSPNHPVFTLSGWVPAHSLRKGDHLFRTLAGDVDTLGTDASDALDDGPPEVEHVFNTLATDGIRSLTSATANDLHNDGRFCKGEISVILSDGGLLAVGDSKGVKAFSELNFSRTNVKVGNVPAESALSPDSERIFRPISRALSYGDSAFAKSAQDGCIADTEDFSDFLGGLAGGVQLDEIVDVKWDRFEGHAYDFQTESGAYALDGLIVHNCRHTTVAYFPGLRQTSQPPTETDPEGYKNTQQLRAMERRVRAAKREAATALKPADRKAANAKVKTAQAATKAFAESKGLQRRLDRERLQVGDPTAVDPGRLTDLDGRSAKVETPKVSPAVQADALAEQAAKAAAKQAAETAAKQAALQAKMEAAANEANTKAWLDAENTFKAAELAKELAAKTAAAAKAIPDPEPELDAWTRFERKQKADREARELADTIPEEDRIAAYLASKEAARQTASPEVAAMLDTIDTLTYDYADLPSDTEGLLRVMDEIGVFDTERTGRLWGSTVYPDKPYDYYGSLSEPVRDYGQSSRGMNNGLRAHNGDLDSLKKADEYTAKQIAKLDKAFDLAPRLPHPVVVVRGTSILEFAQLGVTHSDDLAQLVGQTYTSHAFTSTAVSPVSTGFDIGVKMEILLPAETRAIYMAGDVDHKDALGLYAEENELLVDRETTFRIVEAVSTGKRKWTVRVVAE